MQKEFKNIQLENGLVKYSESSEKEIPYETLLVQIEELEREIFQHQQNITEQKNLLENKIKKLEEKQFLLQEVNNL